MDEWEHLSVVVAWKEVSKGKRAWFIVEEPSLVGMNTVLAHYSAQGYELVQVVPEHWGEEGPGWYGTKQNRLFFKRRKLPTRAGGETTDS